MLATLATAGYRAEDTVASDLLGIEISSANMGDVQSTMYNVQSGNPPNVQNRAPETEHGEEAPLTEDELAAIQMLAKDGLNQEQIAQDAATAANALAEAVANKQDPPKRKCRAKNPNECPKCHPELKGEEAPSLNPTDYEDPSEWIALDVPAEMHEEEARALLEQGFDEDDPLGKSIHFGKTMMDHWADNVNPDILPTRLKKLNFFREVVRNPSEIWQDGSSRTYLASYLDGNKKYVVGFTIEGKDEMFTFHMGSNAVGSKRKGELLYARQKKRAKHPAPDAAP